MRALWFPPLPSFRRGGESHHLAPPATSPLRALALRAPSGTTQEQSDLDNPSPPGSSLIHVMGEFQITPIGQPKPPQAQPQPPRGFERLSNEENQRRGRVSHANRAAGTGREPMRIFAKRVPQRRPKGRHLDADEVLDMTTTLARQFYAEAHDMEKGTATRKYATTSFGILVDKWTIVSGRPTAIIMLADPERAGVLELARRLAASAGERA